MSVFFPRTPTSSADQGFTPLFRLLEDFDSYKGSQVGSPARPHRGHLPTFQPKFDVRETEDSYELHGELPGMDKSDVNIEFADPQTMVVRGRIERTYTSGTSPASGEGKKAEITQAGEESPKRHQATVDDEEEGFTEVSAPSREAKKAGPRDNAKYWVSERSIGEFSRSFNFPGHVDPEAVSATLRDGILSVIVPKHKKSAGRRILVE